MAWLTSGHDEVEQPLGGRRDGDVEGSEAGGGDFTIRV